MRIFAFSVLAMLSINLTSCGVESSAASSQLLFESNSNECKVLSSLVKDVGLLNKGYGTLTITHPEIVSNFSFVKSISKFTQVKSNSDVHQMLRQIIKSFLVKNVPGVNQEQPLRPFVIPELLCPILDENQAKASFCGSQFFNDQPAAIAAAIGFLEKNEAFGNFAAIDKIFQPLAFIKRPPRFDLHATEQTVEARIVYGLRDVTGTERKPATIILEFAGTSQREFYESLVKLFIAFKDDNSSAARLSWAQGIEKALDSFLLVNSGANGRWAINQVRINELAFRGSDILWDFREYNFPNANASVKDFQQVAVANTPWIDFEEKDRDPAFMQDDFVDFLFEKGLTQADLDAEQSIDVFEEFMANPKAKVKNASKLQGFVQSLTKERNDSGDKKSKAFAYHLDANWQAPSALARPGMRFFDGDTIWSRNLKESCQGCHVSSSSIASDERIDSMQGFYHISPRKLPSDASSGTAIAGSNILSPFLLRETLKRFRSMIQLVGCSDPALKSEGDREGDRNSEHEGHSSGKVEALEAGDKRLVPQANSTCTHKAGDQKLTQCHSSRSLDSYLCKEGHMELLPCSAASGLQWLLSCQTGPERKALEPTLLNSCEMGSLFE